MTRAHDRQRTLPQRRCTSCMKTPSASCSLRAPIRRHSLRALACLRRLAREAVQRLAAALVV